jgi:hypothetical protein
MQPIARAPSHPELPADAQARQAPMGLQEPGEGPLGRLRQVPEGRQGSPRGRVAAAARVLQQPEPQEGCRIIRHWSEVPVIGVGVVGCAFLGMGALGSGTLFYIAGGINLASVLPIYPIVRQYGTVRQQVAILERVIQNQRETIEQIGRQLEALSAEVDELAANESEISEHVEVLVDGIARLHQAADDLGDRIVQARAQRDELTREIRVQHHVVADLETTLMQRNQELQALRETAAALADQPEQLSVLLRQRTEALRALEDRIQAAQPSIQDEQALLREYSTALDRLAQGEQLRLLIARLDEKLSGYGRTIEELATHQQQKLEGIALDRERVENALPGLASTLQRLHEQLAEIQLSLSDS